MSNNPYSGTIIPALIDAQVDLDDGEPGEPLYTEAWEGQAAQDCDHYDATNTDT